ncbi:MAG: tRNA lysidine(34) synthetase TilS [Treponema sp.]|nr:tRNA lysidine(34) synthetase TilS [Treponema sp.]
MKNTPDSAPVTSQQNILRFENNVSSFLDSLSQDAVLLAAVSGGADSMAMLAALCAVKGLRRVFCLHVEHGLRPADESRGDAEYVRAFCEKNGIECSVTHIPPGKIAAYAQKNKVGIEAAARFFRHRALSKYAKRIDSSKSDCEKTVILLAHTKDDLLETALMRILRGAGPAGLAAMPQRRGRIARPLLGMTRADVISYLTSINIPWREDSTNTDIKFLRNRIRCSLVPFLNESFPSWKTCLSALGETQALAADFIKDEAKQRVSWDIRLESGGLFSADEKMFFSMPQIIREEALFLAIDELLKGVKKTCPVRRTAVRQFCQGAVNAADLGPVRVRRERGKVLLSRVKKEYFECGYSLLLK